MHEKCFLLVTLVMCAVVLSGCSDRVERENLVLCKYFVYTNPQELFEVIQQYANEKEKEPGSSYGTMRCMLGA